MGGNPPIDLLCVRVGVAGMTTESGENFAGSQRVARDVLVEVTGAGRLDTSECGFKQRQVVDAIKAVRPIICGIVIKRQLTPSTQLIPLPRRAQSTVVQPPTAVGAEIKELSHRLRDDYEDRFGALNGSFDTWWNRTTIGVESGFPGRGHLRPGWDATARYGRLSWWPFGTWSQIKPVSEAEHELRLQIDEFLARGKAPRLPGFLPTLVGWTTAGLLGSAIFALGIYVSNIDMVGWGLLIGGFGFAFAGAALLRRALGQWH